MNHQCQLRTFVFKSAGRQGEQNDFQDSNSGYLLLGYFALGMHCDKKPLLRLIRISALDLETDTQCLRFSRANFANVTCFLT